MFGSLAPSQYKRITDTSTLVSKAGGYSQIMGILCAASTSLIVQVWDTSATDATAGAVQVTGSITLVAGTYYTIPARLNKGLYIKVISGTGDATVFFN